VSALSGLSLSTAGASKHLASTPSSLSTGHPASRCSRAGMGAAESAGGVQRGIYRVHGALRSEKSAFGGV
jgi:hypothetical protein